MFAFVRERSGREFGAVSEARRRELRAARQLSKASLLPHSIFIESEHGIVCLLGTIGGYCNGVCSKKNTFERAHVSIALRQLCFNKMSKQTMKS